MTDPAESVRIEATKALTIYAQVADIRTLLKITPTLIATLHSTFLTDTPLVKKALVPTLSALSAYEKEVSGEVVSALVEMVRDTSSK